jgi:hypothetical protein
MDRKTLKSALAATPDCLTPEQLEKLTADASLQDSHVLQCPRCQAELAMLKTFQSDEALPEEGAAVAWIGSQLERQLSTIKGARSVARRDAGADIAKSWWTRVFGRGPTRIWVPAGAVLAVAIAVLLLLKPSREPELRADLGQGPSIARSQEVETVGASGEVPAAPMTLEWRAVDGAAEYKIALMEVDRVPFWNSQTAANTVSVPATVRDKMLPGKPVLWQVTALDAQGKVLATSQIQRFLVSPSKVRGN